MDENVGLVTRLVDCSSTMNFLHIWSFTTYKFYIRQNLYPTFNVGDLIDPTLLSFVKGEAPELHAEMASDNNLKLKNVPVLFRKSVRHPDRIYGYSPLFGQIELVNKQYDSCLGKICVVNVVWTGSAKWAVEDFMPQIMTVEPSEYQRFRAFEPSRGVVFREQKGSYVVWCERNGIVELNLQDAEFYGVKLPQIGSFLTILTTPIIGQVFPVVREYEVVEPFFSTNQYKNQKPGMEFEIEIKLQFDGATQQIGDDVFQCGTSDFFGKVYSLGTKLKTGENHVTMKGVAHAGCPLMFQVVDVKSTIGEIVYPASPVLKPIKPYAVECPPPAIPSPSCPPIPRLKVDVGERRYAGFISRARPMLFAYCIDLQVDVLVPDHISSSLPHGNWLGRWLSFELSSSPRGRSPVMINPSFIKQALPTRWCRGGFPEIEVIVEIRPNNVPFCPQLGISLEDPGAAFWKNRAEPDEHGRFSWWIRRVPTETIIFRASSIVITRPPVAPAIASQVAPPPPALTLDNRQTLPRPPQRAVAEDRTGGFCPASAPFSSSSQPFGSNRPPLFGMNPYGTC